MICEECGGTRAWSILRKFAFSDRERKEGKETVMIAIPPDLYRSQYLMDTIAVPCAATLSSRLYRWLINHKVANTSSKKRGEIISFLLLLHPLLISN
jgi:hypothetical protein